MIKSEQNQNQFPPDSSFPTVSLGESFASMFGVRPESCGEPWAADCSPREMVFPSSVRPGCMFLFSCHDVMLYLCDLQVPRAVTTFSHVTAMFCSMVLALNRRCCSLRKGKKVYSLCKRFCFALTSESVIAHTENKKIIHIICPVQ